MHLSRASLGWLIALGVLIGVATPSAQGPLAPIFALRGRTDNAGALLITSSLAGSGQGPLTALWSLQGRTDSNGALLVSCSDCGGAIGGSNTQVQFNDSGVLGGDAGFVWDKTNDVATLYNLIATGGPLGTGYVRYVGVEPSTSWFDADIDTTFHQVWTDTNDPTKHLFMFYQRDSCMYMWDTYTGTRQFDFEHCPLGMVINPTARGTGAVQGKRVFIGRNSSGNGAPGHLRLQDKGGTNRSIWFSSAGDLYFAATPPEEDGAPSDTTGTRIATVLGGTSPSIGGGALVAGACASDTVTVTGATTSMGVVATPATYPGDGSEWLAYVSAADTVTVKVCAIVALTPTASTYTVRVFP